MKTFVFKSFSNFNWLNFIFCNKSFQWIDNNQYFENNVLKIKINSLEQQMRGITEDKEILNKS